MATPETAPAQHAYQYPDVISLGEAWRDANNGDDFGYGMKEKSPEVETELSSLDSISILSDYNTDSYSHELGWRTQDENTEEYLGRVSMVSPPSIPPELPKCEHTAECDCE